MRQTFVMSETYKTRDSKPSGVAGKGRRERFCDGAVRSEVGGGVRPAGEAAPPMLMNSLNI